MQKHISRRHYSPPSGQKGLPPHRITTTNHHQTSMLSLTYTPTTRDHWTMNSPTEPDADPQVPTQAKLKPISEIPLDSVNNKPLSTPQLSISTAASRSDRGAPDHMGQPKGVITATLTFPLGRHMYFSRGEPPPSGWSYDGRDGRYRIKEFPALFYGGYHQPRPRHPSTTPTGARAQRPIPTTPTETP